MPDSTRDIHIAHTFTENAHIPNTHRERTDEHLLDLLYTAASQGNSDGWENFLHAVTQVYEPSLVSFLSYDSVQCTSSHTLHSALPPDFSAKYENYYGKINPFLRHSRRKPAGSAMFSESYLPFSELSKTEYYQDFLRPQGVDSSMSVTIQKNDSYSVGLSLLVPRTIYERDPDALNRLQRLTPHLLRATQLHRQLVHLDMRANAAEDGLERLTTATFLVNAAGRIIFMNSVAERIIVPADGLNAVQNTLSAANSQENVLLHRFIASAARSCRDVMTPPGGVMRITRQLSQTPYEVLVTPAPQAAFKLDPCESFAIVFVRDPESRASSPVDWLRRLYGLTGAEARLMQGLITGDTLDAIADHFGLTKETLRSSLKLIFRKTGTSSQGQLIQLALRGISVLQK